jgi:hypothetical protein
LKNWDYRHEPPSLATSIPLGTDAMFLMREIMNEIKFIYLVQNLSAMEN